MNALDTLATRWRTLAPRERRLLALAALVLGVFATVTLAEWTQRERARLAAAVPAARAQLMRMQEQAEELARLGQEAAPPPAATGVRAEAARVAATARGLALDIEVLPDGVLISGSAPAAAFFDWLAGVQAEQRLRPVELELTRGDQALEVSGRLLPVGDDGRP